MRIKDRIQRLVESRSHKVIYWYFHQHTSSSIVIGLKHICLGTNPAYCQNNCADKTQQAIILPSGPFPSPDHKLWRIHSSRFPCRHLTQDICFAYRLSSGMKTSHPVLVFSSGSQPPPGTLIPQPLLGLLVFRLELELAMSARDETAASSLAVGPSIFTPSIEIPYSASRPASKPRVETACTGIRS